MEKALDVAAVFVSVIVPHFNDLGGLDLCLRALERQTYPRDRFEIVVADNNSPQGTDRVALVTAGRARLVVVSERGAGPARNGAVAASVGSVLAFIDSDCVAEPDWLREGVAALSKSDFVGGRVKVLVRNPSRPTATEAFETVFAFDFETYINKKHFTGSGNLFCSRSLFNVVGGFRVGLSEDVEWSGRALAAGYRLGYARGAVVGHPGRYTWADLKSKAARLNLEAWGLRQFTGQPRWQWLLRCVALPLSALVHTPKVVLSRKLTGFNQKAGALVILFRLRFWRGRDCFKLLLSG